MIPALTTAADGASLALVARGQLGTPTTLDATVELALALATLLPEHFAAGAVEGTAELRLVPALPPAGAPAGDDAPASDQLAGHLDLRARDLPGSAAILPLPDELALRLGGTALDADAVIELARPLAEAAAPSWVAHGETTLRWRRQEQALMAAGLGRARRGVAGAASGRTRQRRPAGRHRDAEHRSHRPAVADRPPRRRERGPRRLARGELLAPGWKALPDATLAGGEIELALPDLVTALARYVELWGDRVPGAPPPAFDPATLPWTLLAGQLTARVAIAGPLTTPLIRVEARWHPAAGGQASLVAAGHPVTEAPFARGPITLSLNGSELDLAVPDTLGAWRLAVELDGGTVHLRLVPGAFGGQLGASQLLAALPGATEQLAGWPIELDPGPVRVALAGLDLCPLVGFHGRLPADELALAGRVDGHLSIVPERPAATGGELVLSELRPVGPEGADLISRAPLRLQLVDGVFELLPVEVVGRSDGGGEGRPLTLRGRLELAPDWRLGDPSAELVASLDAHTSGDFNVAALSPLLGVLASGEVSLEAHIEGPPDLLVAELRLTGPAARLF